MKTALAIISTACLLLMTTGCAERQVEYVPVNQAQPAYAANGSYQPQTAYAPAPAQPGTYSSAPVAAPATPPAAAVPPPGPPESAPQVAVAPPAVPPPTPPEYAPYAPDYYVWDGNEYVGVSNGQYVYWAGGAWIIAPPFVLGRFHGWERFHPDWHRHVFRYHRRGRFR